MLKTHYRQKLVEAILFFAANTKGCGKTKVYKLLYLLDFEHFKQTGRSVTEQEYLAWEMGPVPAGLAEEWPDFGDDMSNAFSIKIENVFGHEHQMIVPKRDVDNSSLSRRELQIMDGLAKKYARHTAKEMVEVVHEENGPWKRVFQDGEGRNNPIPYELAVDGKDSHAIFAARDEFRALKKRFAA